MSSLSIRPVTSKPRGVCRYYTTPRGCFAQDKCKFLHAEPPNPTELKPGDQPLLSPYDKAKRCRYYAQGFCKKGDACWFLHTIDGPVAGSSSAVESDEEEACSICFEKPTTYGLLGGCSHIFCMTCIKQWRDPLNRPGGVVDSGNTKKCPMCRTPSKFITPSSRFWRDGTPEKAAVTQAYKDSMARVPCRYFQKSIQKNKEKPICPYGKDCFYQHLNEDGTPYIFKDGVDVCMRKYSMSQRRALPFDNDFMPFSLDLSSLDLVIPGHGLHFLPPSTVDSVASARNRLRDVGRSLEIINQAIGDGANGLSGLSSAVEALRAEFGHVEGPADVRRRAGENAGLSTEESLMQQLEYLMMASLNARQVLLDVEEVATGGLRADTPPPPLEDVEDDSDSDSEPATAQRPRDLWPGIFGPESDDDSMPGLHSVSDTSDEEGEGGGLMEEWYAGLAADEDDEPPPLELAEDAPEPEASLGEATFVTDGRGRVVWSGAREEDKSEPRAETPREEDEGSGSGSSGSGSSGSGPGRSLLNWFQGLF